MTEAQKSVTCDQFVSNNSSSTVVVYSFKAFNAALLSICLSERSDLRRFVVLVPDQQSAAKLTFTPSLCCELPEHLHYALHKLRPWSDVRHCHLWTKRIPPKTMKYTDSSERVAMATVQSDIFKPTKYGGKYTVTLIPGTTTSLVQMRCSCHRIYG